jgi:type IV pilus biogenesis protein CpaD/CtpE
VRRAGLLIALVALLAGCGSGRPATPTTTTSPTTTTTHKPCPVRIGNLHVTVIDGDTLRRVPRARVRLLHRRARTDRQGLAIISGPRRRVKVHVSARGYTTAHPLLNFERRLQTVRIYQPRLQWPVYGATPQRTQAQLNIKIRPPFRRRLGRDRVRRQLPRDDPRSLDAHGTGLLAPPHAR